MNRAEQMLQETIQKGRLLDTSDIKRKYMDVPYGDDCMQALNIYLPNEGEGPFPTIIYVHGGAWSVGDKSDSQIATFIPGLSRGYAVVSVGYRLLPDVHYPENLFDIKAALRWCADNGAKYMLDTDRVALTGASAGAQLALMAIFTQGVPAFEGAPLGSVCNIRAVVDQFAPTDFRNMRRDFDESGYDRVEKLRPGAPGAANALLGFNADDSLRMFAFASPIYSVHKDIPPVLILHGQYDSKVPYQQSVRLAEKIKAIAGPDRVKLVISPECEHADTKYDAEPYTSIIFDFLDPLVKG
ncbi:MAG: alpha/beta hydrolase [Oscillospiraceae bacterium]|nr:alpha/beta hydrolase [Oscillospiraceae bacterium]